jgi:Tol biopolymer transport system component
MSEVWMCHSDGTRCSPLGVESSGGPRWSPDGNEIGYIKLAEEQRGLYFKSLEGGFTRQLATGGVGTWPFAWSKDGTRIYYESNQSGQYEIWRRSVEGHDAVPMTRGGGRVPRESPDGKHVYYAKPRTDASYKWVDLWRVPVEGGEEIPVLTGKLLEAPNWVLWGDVLIYRGWVSEYGQGFINSYQLGTGEEKRLLTFDANEGLFGYGLAVSPDGQWILYSKGEPRNSDILLIENFGGEPIP